MSRVLLEPLNVTITNHNLADIAICIDGNYHAAVLLRSRCTNNYVANESIEIRVAAVQPQPMREQPILDDPATWPTQA
jgi:hypothetical protein